MGEMVPRIFHYLCYRVGAAQLAEDLTSETFERAWRKRHRYRREAGELSSWLFGIARRVAAENARRTRRELRLGEELSQPRPNSPEEAAEKASDFERLAKMLTQLPVRERELIALKYGGGLTNRVIAKTTGLSESNVGTILHRVVGRLRLQWEDEHGG